MGGKAALKFLGNRILEVAGSIICFHAVAALVLT